MLKKGEKAHVVNTECKKALTDVRSQLILLITLKNKGYFIAQAVNVSSRVNSDIPSHPISPEYGASFSTCCT